MIPLSLFACPTCGGDLTAGRDALTCNQCSTVYPIEGGIPRFVPLENYAANFGHQWNLFRRTQLDSYSGLPISRDRFSGQTGWTAEDLAGRSVLDIGCGAGRFAEIALSLGARVVALDYSEAVDACLANLGSNDRLTVVQGNVYALPFKPSTFDFIYCFGVLQHTPDPAGAFQAIPKFLKPGGRLAVDVYPKLLRMLFSSKYWVRPITRRLPPRFLFRSIEAALPVLLPVSQALGRVPKIGRQLRYAIPVANYEGHFELTPEQHREWSLLDTYDMLAPEYDQPQTDTALREWFERAGLSEVEIFRRGVWVGRAIKPR